MVSATLKVHPVAGSQFRKRENQPAAFNKSLKSHELPIPLFLRVGKKTKLQCNITSFIMWLRQSLRQTLSK